MPDSNPLLFTPTDPTVTKRRIAEALLAGHRTVGFLAHVANVTYAEARATLRAMLSEGYIKVVDPTGDGDLHLRLASPGEHVIAPELYLSIFSAIRHGRARTIADIAAAVGLPDNRQFRLAVYLCLRTAPNLTQEPR
jgi:hypothetical protein